MSFQRRQLLQILSYAFGSSFIFAPESICHGGTELHTASESCPACEGQMQNMNRKERKWKK